jgi:hypothetical protein
MRSCGVGSYREKGRFPQILVTFFTAGIFIVASVPLFELIFGSKALLQRESSCNHANI